ncbi:hypothetical protein PKHYL_28410 [Psychrobacter sp. KH172YL61]|uniref:hypothetical protein n=1 Tax=Psychrobacter sp. KH172YL61 TaxID=2517899 RepID=UPI0010B434A5|nr:hypothetical protein [Psychrobacter sp. KH172YL61]BBI68650.1 hypothetical protein PKHYL_28410 [Psychrobacter sp. KH172YL61]
MLYSPLYQSIRLILFGALGLSSLTVNAAINDADTQTTEPSSAGSTSSYLPDTNNSNVTQSSDYNDIRYKDARSQIDNSQRATPASDFDDTRFASDAKLEDSASDDVLNITEINESSDTASIQPSNMPDSDQVSRDTRANAIATPENTVADNRRLDISDESIQDSLVRLAEFYELTPETPVSK